MWLLCEHHVTEDQAAFHRDKKNCQKRTTTLRRTLKSNATDVNLELIPVTQIRKKKQRTKQKQIIINITLSKIGHSHALKLT